MKQIKASEILSKIQLNTKIIKNDWAIIKENIDHKTTEKLDYDLFNVIKDIKRIAKEQVSYKLAQISINMGFVSTEQISENSSYKVIFELSELESQAREINNLLARYRKHGKFYETILDDDFLNKELKSIEAQITAHKEFLDKFNQNKTIVVNEVA